MWCQYLILRIFKLRKYYSILFLLVIINYPVFSSEVNEKHGKVDDSNVIITSDSLNVDSNNLCATFKGSVTVSFEDMIVKTNHLVVYYINIDGKRSVEKIEVPGKLKAIKKLTNEVVIADSGRYIVALNKLILMGNVNMKKDNHIIVTDQMIYFTKLKFLPKKNNEK